MSKRTSRVLGLAAVVAVGLALGVAGAALAEPAPIAPDVQLDEPTPPVLSQECQDWLEWLVDGHAPAIPIGSTAPPNSEPEPAADRIDI